MEALDLYGPRGSPDSAPSGESPGETMDLNRYRPDLRRWTRDKVTQLRVDMMQCPPSPIRKVSLSTDLDIHLYLKDESAHQTGSVKHRLAQSLLIQALCEGKVTPSTPVIEASSGSTAVSEAYYARLLDIPFIAVMARSTSVSKTELIESLGGRCIFVDDPADVYARAREVADELGGHYLDQFRNAERATDWKGARNIAGEIYEQLRAEPHPVPEWIVATAGTGGTATTIGRHVRYAGYLTGVCVADPENSAFFPGWVASDPEYTTLQPSRIEGIGRQRVEESFIGTVVDRMMRVHDRGAIAMMHLIAEATGYRVGGSTGTAIWAALQLVMEMKSSARSGSIVVIQADAGDRYADRYYSSEWLESEDLDVREEISLIRSSMPELDRVKIHSL